jgi:hypothetical protein
MVSHVCMHDSCELPKFAGGPCFCGLQSSAIGAVGATALKKWRTTTRNRVDRAPNAFTADSLARSSGSRVDLITVIF